MTLLVLDEPIGNPRLLAGLKDRGIGAETVGDFGVTGRTDPDVVRRIDETVKQAPWVLVTMDLTIIEDHEGFTWERYALAWVRVARGIRGGAVEREKADIVHRYAHLIREQSRGQHFTYSRNQRSKHPPSLSSQLQRRD